MEDTIAKAEERPGKPVSRRWPPVETLALLIERDPKRAKNVQFFFEHLPRQGHTARDLGTRSRLALEFVEWWQEKAVLDPLPGEKTRERVMLPWETEIHHRVLARVLEARRVMREQRCDVQVPDELAIPCETCGDIITTKAPHFGRTCADCQKRPAYEQRRRVHHLGSYPVWTGGFYKKGMERRRYVWPTVCEHPECVDLFSANRPDEDYCPKHSRVSALRARRNLAPKRTRYRFYPNRDVCEADENGKWFSYFLQVDGLVRECAIGTEGYEAQDDIEFRYLAHHAWTDDRLLIIPISGRPAAEIRQSGKRRQTRGAT